MQPPIMHANNLMKERAESNSQLMMSSEHLNFSFPVASTRFTNA